MTDTTAKVPWHLWAVGVITLLWNAIGIMSYLMTALGQLAALGMTPEQVAYFEGFPAWATGVWALGVWGAFFGSILILLRSRFAVHSLAVSVLGLVGTTYFQRVVTEIPADMESPILDAAIWAITLFTLWYATKMQREGVLR